MTMCEVRKTSRKGSRPLDGSLGSLMGGLFQLLHSIYRNHKMTLGWQVRPSFDVVLGTVES